MRGAPVVNAKLLPVTQRPTVRQSAAIEHQASHQLSRSWHLHDLWPGFALFSVLPLEFGPLFNNRICDYSYTTVLSWRCRRLPTRSQKPIQKVVGHYLFTSPEPLRAQTSISKMIANLLLVFSQPLRTKSHINPMVLNSPFRFLRAPLDAVCYTESGSIWIIVVNQNLQNTNSRNLYC